MKLASLLSAGAKICHLGSECFQNATARFVNDWGAPSFDFIVKVASAADVQNTIRYAKEQNLPFLAVSGGHGFTKSLAEMKGGVGIWMRKLNDVEVADDGKSARVGGGTTSKELANGLWEKGKLGVVGACECTGVTSPILGGGHGYLQGQYGLLADNLISADLVLANGTLITVSESQDSDLFWGLRGAGQNFGVVTNFQYKIYDRTPENGVWAYEHFIFPAEKVEAVYEIAEEQRKEAPVELAHWGLVLPLPHVDPSKHSLIFTVLYQGSALPSTHSQPFHNLAPFMTISGTTDYPGLSKVMSMDSTSFVCQTTGTTLQSHPINIASYQPAALQAAVEIITHLPPDLNQSMFIIEGYSNKAVQAVLGEATAFPDRERSLLLSAFMRYPRGRPDLDEVAIEYGKNIQDIIVRASGDRRLHAYRNYAAGHETVEELYGFESWRLEKLRKLKRRYDPMNRLGYYLSIAEDNMENQVHAKDRMEL